ncbi:hypothetical protein AiwAL_08690 [Acidiphilium sp. AL]|uniref:Major facilitator superfamily (MFS) profile domain-containing protein n=1 Tax=Acidiphilium iwatense TaxID=768198 RepID=A0ABS9DQW3_9PROT|nr:MULTISPECIES: hypothetical protein [Acidiphilium]MCF3945141.1 hypothetical protein [Acidiphilium iwatense]MCU4160186.1 hypothetical protein [Acidiphilium sp. AL]
MRSPFTVPIMAIGTVAGALLGARREKPKFPLLLIGAAALTFTNTTNSLMQLSTEPATRGQVMALRVGIALGGAPIVGWVANHCGPRWVLGVGAASGLAAAIVAVYALARPRPRPSV